MPEPQNVDLRVIAIQDPSPDATCDVVFVHGLDGDPVRTWQHDPKHPDLSFPRLLAADLPSVRVWALGYPAERFGGKYARAMSIEDRAKSILENLAAEEFGPRRIIFIAHSLGGLLVKQMLRAAAEGGDLGWRRVGEAVLGVVFLATPHAGSPLANVADALRRVLGPSAATLDLKRYSAKLLDLREWYSEFSVRNAIETVAFAETRPSKVHGVSIGIVVLKESAWPGGTAKTISIDNVDHFEIAQPPTRDATVYKDVLSNLRLWLGRDNDPRQVPLERETHESDSEEISRFLFRTRRVPLFGRDDELRELQNFLDDPRPFTWCAITGPGGSGKSRLALEFCLRLPPKWRAGFLRDWTSTEFREWTPNRPTVIVIDYVSAHATDVGPIVRGLEGRSSTLPFPVRLVLLERQGDGLWVRKFLGAGEDPRTSRRSQYVSFPAEANPPSNDLYDEVIRLQTLVVKPLSPEALWDCMNSVFKSSASKHTGRSNHAEHKGKLLAHLLEIDPSRRPLFAAFFADAISADPNKLEWDRKALVENVLTREREKFWKPHGVTDVELDVLTLATLVRGVGSDCPDLPLAAHDSKHFKAERYAIACGANASERLPPLEPDMVGELFVLNRFKRSSKRSQAEMRDRGWKIDSLEMSAFFSRAAKDFPDHPALWHLGSSPQTASLRERYIWLMMAAEQLLPICADNGLGSDALNRASSWHEAFWESYRELLSLSSDSKSDRSDEELLALALNRLGYILSTTGKFECAIAVYDELLARFGDTADA